MGEPALHLGEQASLNLDRSLNLDFLDMELPDLQEFVPVPLSTRSASPFVLRRFH